MRIPISHLLGAAGFCVVLPLALTAWAIALKLPADPTPPPVLGVVIAGAGLLLWGGAVATFIATTGLLPLNLQAPTQAVRSGPFRWFADPIYIGFVVTCFGLSAAFRSAPGFWLVSPVVCLAIVALVLGYESGHRPDRLDHPALASLPPLADRSPTVRDRAAALVAAATAALAFGVLAMGAQEANALRILAWAAATLMVPLVVLAPDPDALTQRDLRYFILALVSGGVLALVVGLPGVGGVRWETVGAATTLGATASVARGGKRWLGIALIAALVVSSGWVALGAWPTGLVSGVGALSAFGAVRGHHLAVLLGERIANSWSAVRIGPVRIINYAVFPGIAAAGGVLLFELTYPDRTVLVSVVIFAGVLIGGGLWGRLLESTGRLSRPFGYFGAFLGGCAAVVGMSLATGADIVLMGASLALAATWIQAVGRLRCLVQGCCHGRVMAQGAGIHYHAPHSRAVALARLGGRNLYPTPIFSIYANIASAIVLSRMMNAHMPASLVLGVYLIGAGVSRFAEEGYRGEKDVRRYRGFTIYQWLAIGQLLAGGALTLAPAGEIGGPYPLQATHFAAALIAGLVFAVAMGVDFPRAKVAFARLTPDLDADG